jgi:3-deoxy-7-phosphoheptulonate synthase
MLIIMNAGFSQENLNAVVEKVKELGFTPNLIPGEHSLAVGVTGNRGPLQPELFNTIEGVKEAIPVTKPYKLAAREFKAGNTEVRVGGVTFGVGKLVVIAGPCAVESEAQTLRIAHEVKKAGAHVLRGGAFKPRTSPYSFQGMGREGLKILKKARLETGLPIISEAVDTECLKEVAEYADIVQIGARNMQNFTLLQAAGKLRKPVMLKRGPSATLDEWLQAAEYILSQGNENVILCERGIRSFDSYARNMVDIGAVVSIRELSHLPIVVDPSHGSGRRAMVAPLARAAVAVGANAVMIDVHDRPKEALCDGPQAMLPHEFQSLFTSLKEIAKTMGVDCP